nr:MAG TPA: hypothetical protein [Caudoviricetes sp.]
MSKRPSYRSCRIAQHPYHRRARSLQTENGCGLRPQLLRYG